MLLRVMPSWLFVGRAEYFLTRHFRTRSFGQVRPAKPLASSNPPDVTSPGQRVRALRNRLKAARRLSSRIKDKLINVLKAKALEEVLAAKALEEVRAAKALEEVLAAKALEEVLAAKVEAEVRAAKAEAEVLAAKALEEVRAAKALEEVLAAKVEAEVRAAKAEAEVRVAKALQEVRAVKTEVEKNNLLHSLHWHTVTLAQMRGRLNMRGLLETLEEEVETWYPELRRRTRTETFKNALEHDHYKSLLHCIQTQGNVTDARKAAEFLSMIYASLSRKFHNSKTAIEYQVSDYQVDIDVHALSLQEARALACVAKHLNMRYRIVNNIGPEDDVYCEC